MVSKSKIIYFSIILVIAVILTFMFFLRRSVYFSPEEQHLACVENSCQLVQGIGPDECSPEGSFCGCADTDMQKNAAAGIDFFTQGTARNKQESKTDVCLSENSLKEFGCADSGIVSFEVLCDSFGDYKCLGGRCVSKDKNLQPCIDSDNGLDYSVVGEAHNGKIIFEDICGEDGVLREAYCSPEDGEVLVDYFDCASLGNYICDAGACVIPI